MEYTVIDSEGCWVFGGFYRDDADDDRGKQGFTMRQIIYIIIDEQGKKREEIEVAPPEYEISKLTTFSNCTKE